MNIKLVGWIALVFLGTIFLGIVWYFFLIPKITPQPSGHTPVTLPVSTSTSVGSVVPGDTPIPPGEISVRVQDGKSIVVNDFIHNGVTVADTINPGRYLLAGNLGYCYPDSAQCQAASTTNFIVFYNSKPQSFTIALTEEPVGKARLAMEQFMLKTLGISQQQLCALNYSVGVTRYVNEQYTAKNLGFSFCPGAVVLPQ